MKILTVCSGLDFINYTRRATIEAIHRLNPELDILLFNSVLNIGKKKNITRDIKFYNYHFWTVEKLRRFRVFSFSEHFFRYIKWKRFFKNYDIIFFIDPNQYFLLPYLSKHQKLVYLLRDPSILQDNGNYNRELPILKRTNIVLGISENLCSYYIEKYYGFTPANVHLWPNTVDLGLWDYKRWKDFIRPKAKPLVGLAGNINYVIDIELLIYLAERLPEYDFEIAGKLDLNKSQEHEMKRLSELHNVKHLGFIEYDKFPGIVINWDIGLVAANPGHEYALYLNNNKQYQYMALGKPFVTYRLNADYKEFDDLVFIAENRDDYIAKIREAIKKSYDLNSVKKWILIAEKNSSESRAEQFLKIIRNE